MTHPAPAADRLPARRLDAMGHPQVDRGAVLRLALPLMLNSVIQALLSLTDTWFVGHISTEALAAIASVYFLLMLIIFFLSGVTLCVQTLVAQAFGAGRYRRAGEALWSGLWSALLVAPAFLLLASLGRPVLGLFALDPAIEDYAVAFWQPRLWGGPFAAALMGLMGFFNGIGRTRTTLAITAAVVVVNAALNGLFIFHLGLGIAGSAWATTCAQVVGVVVALRLFLRHEPRRYRPLATWRPRATRLLRQFTLGLPMAAGGAADMASAALFQIMQVRMSAADGAATQIVMMLTSLVYMPGIGFALAGTTLVGQAIGAGDRNWAARLGDTVILMVATMMGAIGVAIALAGPWLVPLFVGSTDPQAGAVLPLAITLLWIAAVYQFFDGLNFGSALCLRGAGDATVPAVLVLGLGACLFVPLTHLLTFPAGGGYVPSLPGAGLGAIGGWSALVVYVLLLGTLLFRRWRHGAWRRIRLD
ncbi:MAG: MATE family efflux transporter [Steroidobacteraceae bacterium]